MESEAEYVENIFKLIKMLERDVVILESLDYVPLRHNEVFVLKRNIKNIRDKLYRLEYIISNR